jgi:hypothetical protein
VEAWHASSAEEGPVLLQIAVGQPHGVERLARAAKVLAGFAHPGCVRLVREELGGDPPHLVLAAPKTTVLRGPLPAASALEAGAAVAVALSAAHASAVWGPDLRAGTVLGPPDAPVVTDWGSAWRAGMKPGEEPEGSVARDLLALGRLVYALLTGLPPGPKDLDPGDGFSDDVRAMVKRLTGPPEARPASAREVAFALRELKADPAATASQAPDRFATPRAMLRRPKPEPRLTVGHAPGAAVVFLLGCVVLGGIAGATALLWLLAT